jgi:hypothetical protein
MITRKSICIMLSDWRWWWWMELTVPCVTTWVVQVGGGRWEKKNLFIIFKHIFSEIVTPFSNVWTIVVFIFDTKIKHQIWIFFKFLYLWFSRYLKWIGTTLHFYCINISDVWCQHLFKNIEHILWREHIMCNHYANELTKFIQNLEKKIINVLLILLRLYKKI